MRLTGTGKRRISLAGRELAARVVGRRVLALALVQVVEREPGPGRVVAELEHVRAVAGLEHDQAEVELEPGPVAAVPGRDPAAGPVPSQAAELERGPVAVPNHRRAHLGVPRRTKSVTAARRHDQVPLLAAEEDLAAVVETTRDPAVTEAGIAWAAAVTVVAVVAPE
jgi:hypothetical protein